MKAGEKFTESKNGVEFSERESSFALKYRTIRSSAVFGTRREAALRGEGFAWVPDLRSLDKLLEVGVSPFLGFIPSLSTLRMFESNEAVRGRLIGPKPWDRIDMNFCTPIGAAVTATADWVVKFGNIILNHVLVGLRP